MTEDGKATGAEVTEIAVRGLGEANLKTAQLHQKTASEYWQNILESIGDGFWVLDRSWHCTYINNRQASVIGMSKDDVVGKNVWELLPELVGTEVYRQLHQAVALQTPVHFEHFYPTWQGWFEMRVYPSANGVSLLTIAITERKQAEELLRETEQRFQAFMNHSPTSAWIADREGQLLYLNPTYFRMFQVQKQDTVGKNILDIYPAEFAQQFLENNKRVFETQQVFETIERAPQPNGNIGQFLVYKFPFASGSGETLLGGVAVDITEWKQAEETRQQREEELRLITDSVPALIAYINSDCRYHFVNRAFTRWFGQPAEQIIGQTVEEFFGETAYQYMRQDVETALAGERITTELWMPFKDGGSRYVRRQYIPDIGIHGEVKGFYALVNDITQIKQAQEALRQSEERLSIALKSTPITLFNQDRELRYTWIYNPVFDYQVDQVIGKRDDDLFPSQDAAVLTQIKRRVLETGIGAREEVKISMLGQEDYFDLTVEPLRNTSDEIIGVTCASVYISERKQVELALRKSEALAKVRAEELEIFMEMVPAAVWIAHDPQGHYMSANRTAYELMRRTPNSVMTATPPDGEYPFEFKIQKNGQDIPPNELPMQQAGLTGQDVEGEFDFVFDDNDVRSIYGRAVPLWDESGNVRGVIGAFLDVTDRKRVEETLREREQRFSTLFNGMDDWVLVYHLTPDRQAGKFIEVNEQACKKLGYTRQELLNMSAADLVGSPSINPKANVEKLLIDKHIVVESVHRAKDGQLLPIEVSATLFTLNGLPTVQAICRDISDRKRAEVALRQSEEEFRQLANAMPQIVWTANVNGDLDYVSQQWHDYTGLTLEQTQDREQYLQTIHPDDVQIIYDRWATALESGLSYQVEFRIRRGSDGVYRWFLVRAVPMKDEQGRVIRWYGTSTDIDDHKQIEETLRQSQERLQLALKAAQMFVWERSCQTGWAICSEGAREVCGFQEGSADDFLALTHPDDLEPLQQAVERALADGTPFTLDYRVLSPDGKMRWLSTWGSIHQGWDSQPERIIGVSVDITERKRVEEALRESNERLNLALAASYMGDWSWDAATDIVTFSERSAAIFGILPGSCMTWTQMRELLHEEDRDRARLEVERAILEHGDYDIEYRVIRPNGGESWIAAKGRAQYDDFGQVLRMIGVVQDITARKRAEQALQESEATARARAQELEALMEITPVALWIAHDPNCHTMSANQTAYDLMQATPGSVATATPADSSYPLQFKQHRNGQDVALQELPMQRAISTGQEVIDELEFVFEDGTVRFIYGKAIPLRNETGSVRGAIGAFVDVTQRKHAEREREQLLARERAAREEAEAANRIKDEFLAVLSHELRSPLNPILGWTKLLRTRKFDEQATNRALETIERNATLQTQLIEDLLDVSRILQGKMVLSVSPVNLATTIEAALETVRLAAEAKAIQIKTCLAPNVGLVSGDAARLQQVIWNLVSNAVKFTPRGGRVEVWLEQADSMAQIKVSDTGKGIKQEFLPYVFEYFRQADSSTTRKFGGLGLGLAIVRHFVELHGGLVYAESSGEGLGATFTVRLPLMEVPHEVSQDVQFERVADLSGLQILVVDDEADIRELVAFVLEEFGARVTVTASAKEALAALNQCVPDVLLSDIGMPDVDGYMLMRQVRTLPAEQGGQVKAIALTAYAGEYNQQQAIEAGFQMHIAKPVEPEELVRAIARLVRRA